MGDLSATLSLTDSSFTTDNTGYSVSHALVAENTGDFTVKRVKLSTTGKKILNEATYGASYVTLKNLDDSITINIQDDASGSNVWMVLKAGEFAFFPWNGTVAYFADAASGTPFIEVGIFEQAP